MKVMKINKDRKTMMNWMGSMMMQENWIALKEVSRMLSSLWKMDAAKSAWKHSQKLER